MHTRSVPCTQLLIIGGFLLLAVLVDFAKGSNDLDTVPEKVPEKTPGAWLTKLSMMAPGLRERVEGLVPLPLPPPLLLLLVLLQLA